jgi:hypothetical protein
MFEDQTVELLPARTVMTAFTGGGHGGRTTTTTNNVNVAVVKQTNVAVNSKAIQLNSSYISQSAGG